MVEDQYYEWKIWLLSFVSALSIAAEILTFKAFVVVTPEVVWESEVLENEVCSGCDVASVKMIHLGSFF